MPRTAPTFCVMIALLSSYGMAIAAAEDNTQTLESLVAEAHAAQSRGDFSGAADRYRKAVALEPSIPELWANLGLMEHESGKISQAMTSFRQAARLKPSLFVPQLFLGLEYLQSNQAATALPHLENAVRLNPTDIEAVRSLGIAYAALKQSENATEQYSKEVQLAPDRGDPWLDLGVSYLQQTENDARLMTSTYSDSAYGKLRAAEVFAEEGKLLEAEEAYKHTIAATPPPVCGFAEYGIVFLRQHKPAAARDQFERELQTHSNCGLAILGLAIVDAASGDQQAALVRLASIADADRALVRSSLPLFRGSVTPEQGKSLVELARAKQDASSPTDLANMIEGAFLSDETSSALSRVEQGPTSAGSPAGGEQLDPEAQHSSCGRILKGDPITANGNQKLAYCSFYASDFQTTSLVAQALKKNPETRAEGLYWESKADQKLAIASLLRAGEIDANSPRMHVLLGDVFRQKRRWDEAETEYRKAVALDPKSRNARLSLAITLFSELKTEEAFSLDESLLTEDAADSEASLLAGEILVQRNQFPQAEPYLRKCANLKPELVARCHALLGKVDAEANRVPAAIAEYRLGMSTDEDGSIHYQLARLYRKSGRNAEADEAFKEAQRLVARRIDRARLVLEQSGTDVSRQ